MNLVHLDPLLPDRSIFLAVSRNPLQGYMRSWHGDQTTYNFVFGGKSLSNVLAFDVKESLTMNLSPVLLEQANGKATGPFGHIFYCVDVGGRKGIWHEPVDPWSNYPEVTFTMGGTSGFPGTQHVQVWYLNEGEWQFEQGLIWSSPQIVYTPTKRGYHAYTYVADPFAGGTANVTIAATYYTPKWGVGIYPAPSLPGFSGNLDEIRVLGASGMISQTANVLNKGGKVVGIQLNNRGPDSMFSAGALEMFSNLAELNNAVEMPLETGMYGFHRPIKVMDMVEYFVNTNGITHDVHNPYENSWVWMFAQSPTEDGATFLLTTAFSLEYATSTKFLTTDIPRSVPNDWAQAVSALSVIPQFHENPLHFRDILNGLKKGFQFIAGTRGLVSAIVTGLTQNPGLGLKLEGMARALSRSI